MDINFILNNHTRKTNLDENIRKHTNFENIEDLVDEKHNFRPTLYIEDTMNHLQKVEIKEIAEFYNAYMIANGDPRRIYQIGN